MAARVLVIEDNPTNLDLMSYLLRAFGHEALRATAGAAGVEAAAGAGVLVFGVEVAAALLVPS